MRIVVASIFTLMLGLIMRSTLAEMRGEAQVLTLIAIFGSGLLVMMGNEVIDSWARRLRRKSERDSPDE